MSNKIIEGAMNEIALDAIEAYGKQQELRETLGLNQCPCPRCGKKLREEGLVMNALSRFGNAYICPDCGVEEAFCGGKPDFPNWYAVRKGFFKKQQFAASGSSFDPTLEIYGEVNGTTFTSEEYTGTMDSQKFWDDLAAYAANIHAFVRLMY